MRPLRLLMVARRFWPLSGAAEKTAARLAVGLAGRQCRPTILTARWHPRWPERISWHELPVVRISPSPLGRWNTWRYARAVARWLRRHQDEFDLVYVWGLQDEAGAAVRALGSRRPIVLRADRAGRYGDCFRQIDSASGRRNKGLCPCARAVVAPTPTLRRELEAAGYPRRRIHDIPLGVPALSPRNAQTRAAARNLLGEASAALRVAPWEQLVVSTVRVAAGRGWEHLVAAWPEVVRRRPGARLWLAGEAPDRAAAERQIELLGLGRQILLAGVFDELDMLLGAADLAVVPATEGSPVPLLEAMAAGLPAVATDVAGHRDLAADGREALLVPPADSAAMAAAVARLLEDSELAGRLASAAQARAASDFSLARMVEEHLALFDSLT
ncbi:MAG: glycosyltransferase family 4 protein [Thermoguttaceae bacterium]